MTASSKIMPAQPAKADSDDYFRTFEGHLVLRLDCPRHGFAGWALGGTSVRCRDCGRRLVFPSVDLPYNTILDIKPLQ